MKRLSTIFSFLLIAAAAIAQSDTSFHLVRTIRGDIVSFTVDNLDNVYILNSRNQVKKLNANGDSVAVFNEVRRYGKASLIDVSNPLKVLLYYEDFATIVVLDRFLNMINTIDLRKQNIFQAKAICQSYDNKAWVYDEVQNKLKKVDDDGTILLETPDFRQVFGQAPTPQKIFDQDKYVYLYDSLQGIFVFDYYGTLKNKIMISHWHNFRVAGKYIFGANNDILHRYEISTFSLDEWKMPEQIYKSRSFSFSASRLYALKQGSIEVYSYQ
jgi:hypothetical protein